MNEPIIRKLTVAKTWLNFGRDYDVCHDIILVCENLLDQSWTSGNRRDYSGFWERHGAAIDALNPTALDLLIDLVISDCEIAIAEYDSHPLLEKFSRGKIANAAKRSRTHTCQECGCRFQADKKS